jgi:uracil-DNA glycosylase
MLHEIPVKWRGVLGGVPGERWYRELDAFLDGEIAAGREVLPAREDVFNALRFTEPDAVRVVLLGQDPYPTPGHAHGLCFSVRPDVRPLPRSLKNIYKELGADLGGDNFATPAHGCLESWARQGVLMLNTVLTVRAGEANSHQRRGWEIFTDRVIAAVNAMPGRVVFVLWGGQARAKRGVITGAQHRIVESAHPSPLSARLFFGCRCFSEVNRHLAEAGRGGIDWRVPDLPVAGGAGGAGGGGRVGGGAREGLLPGF